MINLTLQNQWNYNIEEYVNVDHYCHNPNLGLVTKARACKSAGQE
jgi:hypothetical protein